MSLKRVVIGLIGTKLDSNLKPERWEKWRPTVSLFQHEDLLIDRLELLSAPRSLELCEVVKADVESVSPETEVRLHELATKDPWEFEQVYGTLHDFALAYPFDPESEEYLLHITTGTHVNQICLFLLAESKHFPAKLIQTSPPRRRHHQGAGSYRIIDLDLSRYDLIARRFQVEQEAGQVTLKAGIDTRNSAFNRLIAEIEQVAIRSREPILLTGPTGAGKSALARRIDALKRARRQVQGRFVEVNCATLRGDAAMSTLFGHRRGAFTGALQDRDGLLRAADGGLLFLDEIGELGLDEQAMLLRAIEEKRFLPMGADRETQSDFQLIAGTNRNLGERVREGHFREDLLARINLWTYHLPGLAERREDLEPNLDYELDRFAERTSARVTFNKEARQRFLDFATSPAATWNGNFRDLGAAVTRMATLAPGGRINVEGVEREIARLETAWRPAETNRDDELLAGLVDRERLADIDRFDRVQLAEVVRVCRDSRFLAEAGRSLFAASRLKKKQPNDADRLRKYLARFGLEWADVQGTSRSFKSAD
ncbi:MAG: RNA repair transcriptional activator RtcR [Acidobacteriota bacterium]